MQVVSLFALTDDESVSVAWWAHIGGFAIGLFDHALLRSRLRERLESELKVASDLPNAGQGVDSAGCVTRVRATGLEEISPMKVLVAVKRVVDFNVKIRVKADGSRSSSPM